jgi:uncharacterized phosphatase
MIVQKDFYFIRHGQTDHNLLEGTFHEKDCEDIPLNAMGRKQAEHIEPLVSSLPIQVICSSPLKRAQETKAIISPKLQVIHYEIEDLTECSQLTWNEMARLGMYSSLPQEGAVRQFMDQVRKGMNHALSFPGPALIVAHGGVHWATCCLMGIETHDWGIDNCEIVHFSWTHGKWVASRLHSHLNR